MLKTVCWYWCLFRYWYSRMRLRRVHFDACFFHNCERWQTMVALKVSFPKWCVLFTLVALAKACHTVYLQTRWGSASLLCPEVLKDLDWWPRLLTCIHTMGLNGPIDILPHTSFINLGKLNLLDTKLDIMPPTLLTSLGYFEDQIPYCV